MKGDEEDDRRKGEEGRETGWDGKGRVEGRVKEVTGNNGKV